MTRRRKLLSRLYACCILNAKFLKNGFVVLCSFLIRLLSYYKQKLERAYLAEARLVSQIIL